MSHESRSGDPLREATINALTSVVDPLLDLMFDTGVTVQEFSHLVRERAVRAAARRIARESGRDSKSRVAIVTGLPRSEVARILKSNDISSKRLGQHPARRVLAAWYDNPRFLTIQGDPAVLPIFGRRRSFEQLVAMHSGGIPVRAMLDELAQLDAVEILSDQKVKAKSRAPILTGLTSSAIARMGEHVRDLLETLTYNLKSTAKPLFEGSALIDDADLDMLSLVRREIAEQGASFINSANSLLARSRIKPRKSMTNEPMKCRLGVTIFYFQDDKEIEKESRVDAKRIHRKNLQRKRRPAKAVRKPRVSIASIENGHP